MSARQATLLLRLDHIEYAARPTRPAPPEATSITSTGATLTWPAVSGADVYRVQRSTDLVAWTTLPDVTSPTLPVTGLTPATAYHARVAALNESGVSDYSEVASFTTAATSSPPSPPAAPVASQVSETTATLTWGAVTGAASYTLQRAPGGTTTWATVYTGTDPTFPDSGLVGSTSYAYRVSASNADGTSAYSPTTTITTDAPAGTPPEVPATPAVSGTTTTSISLTWPAVPTATTYTLQRSATGTGGWATVYTGGTPSRTDTGLTAATTYHYRVSASNAAGTSGYSAPKSAATNTTSNPDIRPVSAKFVRDRTGIRCGLQFQGDLSIYKPENADAICELVAATGLKVIRGLFTPSRTTNSAWADAMRATGLKWLMPVVPESGTSPTTQTVTETIAKVNMIADEYADVCAGIEGINEPNHNRGGGTVPLNWANTTFLHQRAIWETAKQINRDGSLVTGTAAAARRAALAGVVVVGPSLHDEAADDSYDLASPSGGTQHYHQLLNEGILPYQDMAGLHTYPGGSFPTRKLDPGTVAGAVGRLTRIYDAYGANYPVWCTEHGWHNKLTTTSGHKPISEAGAGTYGPRAVMQFLTRVKIGDGTTLGPARNLRYGYFEFGDDYDGNAGVDHETRFGMWAVSQVSAADAVLPAKWRRKPVGDKIAGLLNRLTDPDGTAAYTPPLVVCKVSTTATGAKLQWQVTATKAQADAGRASLWIWRDMNVWNRDTEQPITVLPVAVTVRDRVGVVPNATGGTTHQVDAEVQEIELR